MTGFKQAASLVAGIIVALSTVSPAPAQAGRVTPMIVDLEPEGRNSVGRIELTNDADRDIAYEVQMMRGEISPDGKLDLTPADEQFVVFPPQAIVEARSQQVFRIQYVGEEALVNSQIYYLSIKQVPVAFEAGANQVQVVINYNVLVNVVPENTSAVATVRSAQYVERPVSTAGLTEQEIPAVIPVEKGILVDLANEGSRYFFAGNSRWKIDATTVSGTPYEMAYSGNEMTKLVGVGVIAPGKYRTFFLPTDATLAPDSVRISVEP